MKNSENIKRTEEYTENTACCYRLPNTSTMENLSMKGCAGEGAVLKMGDKVLVTDHAWRGFIAGVYEFIEDEEETGYSYIECRLNGHEQRDLRGRRPRDRLGHGAVRRMGA